VARTQAAMSREVFARMYKIKAFGGGRGQKRIDDAVDQFDHLRSMADGEKENLQGTIEFYQARTNTKVTIAAERLAVIAAITLPVTALSSILGLPHRQRRDATVGADARGGVDGGHVGAPAHLGEATRLVVTEIWARCCRERRGRRSRQRAWWLDSGVLAGEFASDRCGTAASLDCGGGETGFRWSWRGR
jgi:hypothetical protein